MKITLQDVLEAPPGALRRRALDKLVKHYHRTVNADKTLVPISFKTCRNAARIDLSAHWAK